MNNLKHMCLLMALVSVMTVGFTSCSSDDKDDTPAPIVKLEEANIEGDELCVEANIVAQGRVSSVVINVCNPSGSNVKVAYPVMGNKYIGVLNIEDFHVHVDIAEKNVSMGDLLTLTVTDANGRSTTAKKSITEEEDQDDNYNQK